ncbi:MAG: LysR family transcriptional regulator [Halocynthiibacter sp.]
MDTSLKALRYFMAAVNNGSITKASRQMHVVPSAVLAAVNQVEEVFGLKLTTRHRSKGITPTATGQILMTRIQHLLDEYDTLIGEGAEMRTQLTGTLRVGYYAPVAPAFLPGIARGLLADNPRVDIKFTECDNQTAQAGLISGAFDVILCVAESMKPGVTYETLIEVPAYLLVPQNHDFASRDSLSLADLRDENLILLDLPVVSEYYSRVFEDAGVTPRIVSTATTLEMVRSLVGAGLGCSLLHMRPATNVSYSGDTVAGVPLRPPADPLKIVLGHLPDNPRRVVKAFVEDVRDLFSKEDTKRLLVTLRDRR